mgnify:CR=1 FL=1
MEIFGKQIFGDCAKEFLNLPILSQVEWIKKYTNQQNDNIIDEFLSNIKENENKECLNCGQNGNISKGIPKEIESIVEQNSVETTGKRNSPKRQRKVKG